MDDWVRRLREKSDSRMMNWETGMSGEGKQREAMLIEALITQIFHTCSHHTLLLQRRKLALREVKYLAQGHTASRWQSWDLNPSLPSSEAQDLS